MSECQAPFADDILETINFNIQEQVKTVRDQHYMLADLKQLTQSILEGIKPAPP